MSSKPRPVVLALAVAVALVVLVSPLLGPAPSLDDVVFSVLVGGSFLAVGCAVLLRGGWHRIGWLLVATGVMFSHGIGTVIPFLPWYTAWAGGWSFNAAFACLAYTTLVFPSGRLPSRTGLWRAGARAVAGALPVLVLLPALVRVSWGPEPGFAIPFGFLPSWVGPVGAAGTWLTLLAGAVSLVVRFRRSAGEVRAQLAWVVSALTLVAATVGATFLYLLLNALLGRPDPGDDIWGPAVIAYLTLPVAFLVAITRYRLYDIDRLISRTVTYALVVGLLVAVYAGGVLLLGVLLPLQGELAVAASTLAVAALFNPLRRRVQERVDRRFNRARYDAKRELERFAAQLRDQVNLDALGSELVRVVTQTMEPTTVSLWLRDLERPMVARGVDADGRAGRH